MGRDRKPNLESKLWSMKANKAFYRYGKKINSSQVVENIQLYISHVIVTRPGLTWKSISSWKWTSNQETMNHNWGLKGQTGQI